MKLFFSSLLAAAALFSGTAQADALEKSVERKLGDPPCVGSECDGPCYLTNQGDISYVPKVALKYSIQATEDLTLTFTAPPVGPSTGSQSFEAVVWAADEDGCRYDLDYLGETSMAASTINPVDPTPTLFTPSFGVNIAPLTGNNYAVNIDTIFVSGPPATPGYSENLITKEGTAYMCIEFQQFACGVKVDFETVFLEITYELESECGNDPCGEDLCPCGATITRDGPVEDDGTVAAPPIICEVAEGPYYQGDQVEVCVKYPDYYLNDDVCFNYFAEWTATLSQGSPPTNSVEANLLALPDNGFVQVGPATCVDPTPLKVRECCVTIVPSPQWLQGITGSASLTFDITLISTYIDCPGQVGGSRLLEGVEGDRRLEDAVVSRASATVGVVGEEESEGCGWNFVCMVMSFFRALFSGLF